MLLRKTGHYAAHVDIPTRDPFCAIENCLKLRKDRRRPLIGLARVRRAEAAGQILTAADDGLQRLRDGFSHPVGTVPKLYVTHLRGALAIVSK